MNTGCVHATYKELVALEADRRVDRGQVYTVHRCGGCGKVLYRLSDCGCGYGYTEDILGECVERYRCSDHGLDLERLT